MKMNGDYNVQDPKRGARNIALLVLALAGIVVLISAIYFFTKVNSPTSSQDVPINFSVNKGASTRQVAEQLNEQNVINNPLVFVANAMFNNAGSRIQAGDYVLNRNMSIAEILDTLTAGRVIRDEVTVIVIEGWSNKQIKAHLESTETFEPAEFDQALEQEDYDFKFKEAVKRNYEGFLFPDTYQISKTESSSDLIQKMLTNFELKFTDSLSDDLTKSGRKLEDVIILASIIEKEVGRNKEKITKQDEEDMQRERELVASVFYNRLDKGMALESDATVNYITGKSDRQVTFADLEIDSPYNTYRVSGLPPGPIGNPGIGSIDAAINPAQSDYFFFINTVEGEAVFGKTLKEHNENRAKYLD